MGFCMLLLVRTALLALVLGCAPAMANDEWPPAAAPADALPGHPGKTYLDLVNLLIPDMVEEDGAYTGTTILPMHHIGGYPAEAPGVMKLEKISVLPVNSDGKPRLALFFNLGETPGAVESFSVLALYDLSGEPVLLSAIAVGLDRFTSLYAQEKMPVSNRNDVILTVSTHFNSSQGYVVTSMMLVREDRFELIDSIFTLDEKICSYERAQAIRYDAKPGAALFADIRVTVVDKVTPTDLDCGSVEKADAETRTFTGIYRWHGSEGRYLPDDDSELEMLQEENRQRM
jgi:hypothetical protein